MSAWDIRLSVKRYFIHSIQLLTLFNLFFFGGGERMAFICFILFYFIFGIRTLHVLLHPMFRFKLTQRGSHTSYARGEMHAWGKRANNDLTKPFRLWGRLRSHVKKIIKSLKRNCSGTGSDGMEMEGMWWIMISLLFPSSILHVPMHSAVTPFPLKFNIPVTTINYLNGFLLENERMINDLCIVYKDSWICSGSEWNPHTADHYQMSLYLYLFQRFPLYDTRQTWSNSIHGTRTNYVFPLLPSHVRVSLCKISVDWRLYHFWGFCGRAELLWSFS